MTRKSREHTTHRVSNRSTTGGDRRPSIPTGHVRSGFSMIDLLVSITVMAVLIGILAPSLFGVTEAARRVRCASNIRQIGLALNMYFDEHDGQPPPTVFGPEERDPRTMMVLHRGEDPHDWDGLGFLVAGEYLPRQIFYCPSHTGFHPAERYEDAWLDLGAEIVGNYQFRPPPTSSLTIQGGSMANFDQHYTLLSDGLRPRPDYNHGAGNNILRADLSVSWFTDVGSFVSGILPQTDSELHRFPGVFGAWHTFDTGEPPDLNPGGGHGPTQSLLVGGGSFFDSPN